MANANIYDVGDLVRLSVTFTVSSVDTDPTTVALKVKNPAGVVSTYTYALAQVAKDATGKYHKDISLNMSGHWRYRWEGTGTVESAGDAFMKVRYSEVLGA
jgi:hypothetical protein